MTAPTYLPPPRRSWFAPTFAALGLVFWLVAVEGCLNPRPEEYPSSATSGGDATDPVVPAPSDDCTDSPLSADCDDGTPVLEPPMAVGPDVALDADAGRIDAGGADASAPPDASTNANQ